MQPSTPRGPRSRRSPIASRAPQSPLTRSLTRSLTEVMTSLTEITHGDHARRSLTEITRGDHARRSRTEITHGDHARRLFTDRHQQARRRRNVRSNASSCHPAAIRHHGHHGHGRHIRNHGDGRHIRRRVIRPSRSRRDRVELRRQTGRALAQCWSGTCRADPKSGSGADSLSRRRPQT